MNVYDRRSFSALLMKQRERSEKFCINPRSGPSRCCLSSSNTWHSCINVAKCNSGEVNLEPMHPAVSMICGMAARACLAMCLHLSSSCHNYTCLLAGLVPAHRVAMEPPCCAWYLCRALSNLWWHKFLNLTIRYISGIYIKHRSYCFSRVNSIF